MVTASLVDTIFFGGNDYIFIIRKSPADMNQHNLDKDTTPATEQNYQDM